MLELLERVTFLVLGHSTNQVTCAGFNFLQVFLVDLGYLILVLPLRAAFKLDNPILLVDEKSVFFVGIICYPKLLLQI